MVSIIHRVDLLGNTVVDWICKLSYFRLDTLHKGIYRAQCRNHCDLYEVPVWISNKVESVWEKSLETAITEINEAAPGLHLYFVTDSNQPLAKILVFDTSEDVSSKNSGAQHCQICDHLGSDVTVEESPTSGSADSEPAKIPGYTFNIIVINQIVAYDYIYLA